MPTERERKHICDFSRGGLNARLHARIQTLLRGHKYAFFLFQWADFGYGTKLLFKVEVIWRRRRTSSTYFETILAIGHTDCLKIMANFRYIITTII